VRVRVCVCCALHAHVLLFVCLRVCVSVPLKAQPCHHKLTHAPPVSPSVPDQLRRR
jgi:hypothetical protein